MSLFKSVMTTNKNNKIINKANKVNRANRGVVEYRPSPIEAFFDSGEPVGGMVVSGGANDHRIRAIATQAICAFNQGMAVVVLHEGNTELENKMSSEFGSTGQLSLINRANPYYEPFLGLTNPEVSRMIIQSQEKDLEMHSQSRYYLDGMAEFLKIKGIAPYCDLYIRCPHLELEDKVRDAEQQGKIDYAKASHIRSMLAQGRNEQSNVEEYFFRLSHQASGIMAKKATLSNADSICNTAKKGGVIVIDVLSTSNSLFLNLLLQDIENALTSGKKLLVVFDNVFTYTEQMTNFIKTPMSNCKKVFCSEDVYAMLGSDENLFATITGNAVKNIVYSHRSGVSCTKWAEFFGQFDMQEVSQTVTRSKTYKSFFNLSPDRSVNNGVSIGTKREYIVKPEEINRMGTGEVYISDGYTQSLSHTTVK